METLRGGAACAVAIAALVAMPDAHAQTPHKRTKSSALIAGGVGTIIFGVAAGGAGALLTFVAAECGGCVNPTQPALFGLSGLLDLLSLGGIGGGIAMITIGARKELLVPAASVVGECAITSDCADAQHCIDGRCRALGMTEEAAPPRASDAHGYVVSAIITDACAFLTTIPPWMAAYAGDFSRFDTGFQILPFIQLAAGPALHLFEGRLGPAAISLLGWSAVALTTYFVPTAVSPYGDEPNGLAAGTAMLALGGIAMTVVDAVMARPLPLREPRPETVWAPVLHPVFGGAVAGFSGSF